MFVKVCGLSTSESVRAAVEAGADAVGFVLTGSPGEVTPAQARELLAHVPAGLPAVGVFRHEAAADAVAAPGTPGSTGSSSTATGRRRMCGPSTTPA